MMRAVLAFGLLDCAQAAPKAVVIEREAAAITVAQPRCRLVSTSEPLRLAYTTTASSLSVMVEHATAGGKDAVLDRAVIGSDKPGSLLLPANTLTPGEHLFLFWINDPHFAGDAVRVMFTALAPVLEGASAEDADGDCYSPLLGDCNDGNANVHPAATELCTDSIDNNCDTHSDCSDTACSNTAACVVAGQQLPTLVSASRATGSIIAPHTALSFVLSKTLDRQSLQISSALSVAGTGAFSATTEADDTLTITPTTAWPVGADRTLAFTVKDLVGNTFSSLTYTYVVDDTPSFARFVPSYGKNEVTPPDALVPGGAYLTSPQQTLVVLFNHAMDTTSVSVSGAAATTSKWASTFVVNDTLTLSPPAGGWPSTGVLHINALDGVGNPATQDLTVDFSTQLFTLPFVNVPIKAYRLCQSVSQCADVTAQDVDDMVLELNTIYSVAHVVFSYVFADLSPSESAGFLTCPDMVPIKNGGVTGPSSCVNAVLPSGPVGGLMPNLTVLFHDGAGSATDGWSAPDQNYVMMPNRTNSCSWMMAHNVGHYFGLLDTAKFPATGSSPNIYDGDGLLSTAPDPYMGPTGVQCNSTGTGKARVGSVEFELPVDNVMSFYNSAKKTLTTEQAFAVRQAALARLSSHNMNDILPGTTIVLEGESLSSTTVATTAPAPVIQGGLTEYFANFGVWSDDQHRWWANDHHSNPNPPIAAGTELTVINLPVATTDDYHVYAVLTKAGGYGVFKLGINSDTDFTTVDLLDLRAVRPSLPIDLGVHHLNSGTSLLHVWYLKTNSGASETYGQQFGVDYILLQH